MSSDFSILRPERAAHATIRGYLYQICLGVQRWLELGPEEILLCEGDEDLDRRILGGGGVSEQVKVSSDGLGLSDRVVRESLRNFLVSYVALRGQGETRRFHFTTTAPARRARGFDLLAAWKNGERGPKVTAGVRNLLGKQEANEKKVRRAEVKKALASLDTAPDGWLGFLDAVEWTFGAPDLKGVRGEIGKYLAARDDTRLLPAEELTDRLVAAVFHASSRKEPRDRVLTGQSLADLLEELREGLGRWAQNEGKHLRAVFDEVREIRRLLDDGTLPLPEDPPPGKLLTAAYEVIPFDESGRREELALLEGWCNGEPRRSVLLLTGEGGSGKTRLLIEWCRRLRHQGWHAGFLRKDRGVEDLDRLLDGAVPRLIVIDYAETRLGLVEALLEKVAIDRDRREPKLRLVCLARRPGDWWDGLRRKEDSVEDLLRASPDPRPLSPLASQPEEREQVFRVALRAFAGYLGRKVPVSPVLPDLTGQDFGRALYLHMAAFAALSGERIESAQDALEQTLVHERRFWRSRIRDLRLDGARSSSLEGAVEPAVAALTLVQGVAEEGRARDLLQQTLNPPGLPADLFESLLGLLETLYGGTESRRFLDPLQPDLLGEQLVAERLAKDAGWLSKVIVGARPEEKVAVLAVLVRLAQRRPEAQRWLEGALRGHLEELAAAAVLATVAAGDLVGKILAETLREHSSAEVAKAVMDLCDRDELQTSVYLREVAFVATEKTLQSARAVGDTSEQGQAELALILVHLGIRLGDLGRREEAFQFTQEAVGILSQLATQSPDTFLPDLAGSLDNLGNRLSALGHHKEALRASQEAVALFRQLAEQRRGDFLQGLATSLNNLGNMLGALGYWEEALRATEEAVSIRRQLAEQRPDVFLPKVAGSLNNLGGVLGALGRREEALRAAEEASGLYRQLTKQRPDVFHPYLAASLNNLGVKFSELGRWEEAFRAIEEAVGIRRQLAEQRPEAFLSNFAESLNNLGNAFSNLGRREEALRATEEAVGIRRHLAKERPAVFLPDLASSLNNLGNRLSDLGRWEEALRPTEESVGIRRHLTEERSAAFLPDLASSLNSLGNRLSELGRWEEALRATQEAAEFYRQLAEQRPDAFLPNLAMSLDNLGNTLTYLGRREDALQVTKEAADLYKELAEERPETFLPDFAVSLGNLGSSLRELGRNDEALQMEEEAIRTLSPFFVCYPDTYFSWMKIIVGTYLKLLNEIGREPNEQLLSPIWDLLSERLPPTDSGAVAQD